MSNQQIHASVQEYYSSRINSQQSCCGDDSSACCASDLGYQPEALNALPQDITEMSYGCGDPVTIAGLKAGEVVLDLGSGAGMDSFLARRQVGESGRVIGVDMTPAMLEKARHNAARLGYGNVEFVEGYIEALPLPDASADVIMSNCVINLSPDKAAVFREAYRVLKAGGRLAVSDMVTLGAFSEAQRADAQTWAECISGAIDVRDYVGMMEAAGFQNIEVLDKTAAELLNVTRAIESPEMPRLFSARITAQKPT